MLGLVTIQAWTYGAIETWMFYFGTFASLGLLGIGLFKLVKKNWTASIACIAYAVMYFFLEFSSTMLQFRDTLSALGANIRFHANVSNYESEVKQLTNPRYKEWRLGFQGLTEFKVIYDESDRAGDRAMRMNDAKHCLVNVKVVRSHFYIIRANCT